MGRVLLNAREKCQTGKRFRGKHLSGRVRERGRTYVNGAVGVAIVVGLAQIGYGSVG